MPLLLRHMFNFHSFVIGDYTVVWRKGHQVLAAGSHMLIKDARFKIQNNELELTKIFPQDAGDFVCQISLSAGETLEIAHTVEVLGKCYFALTANGVAKAHGVVCRA